MADVDSTRDRLLEMVGANQKWLLDKFPNTEIISAHLGEAWDAFHAACKAQEAERTQNPPWCGNAEWCEDEGPCIKCIHRNGEVY